MTDYEIFSNGLKSFSSNEDHLLKHVEQVTANLLLICNGLVSSIKKAKNEINDIEQEDGNGKTI
jgi:hypothetical protein